MDSKDMEDLFGELHFPYKVHKKKLKELPVIETAEDVFEYIWPTYEPFVYEKEVLYAIFLNNANKILGRWKISEGSMNATLASINMLMARALLVQAFSIIIVHNHPSGFLKFSNNDIEISKKIDSACKTLELKFLDGLIISPDKEYKSIKMEGLM